MIPVSDRFLAALRGSHSIVITATLYRPSAPTVPVAVQVIGGSLRADTDARIRRQAGLDAAFSLDYPGVPELVRELPFGGQAVLERGIAFADGSVEKVQLGRFRIDAVNWSEVDGKATFSLSDRMAQVQDEPFLTPWAPAGLKPSDAAVEAVSQVFGTSIAYHILTDPASEPALVDTIYDEDRASAVAALASSAGAEAFFDYLGDFVIRPRPGTGSTPVWTLDAGAQGVLVESSESLDRSSVRNGVAVRGQLADGTPVFSLAVDSDASSPTLWGGPFGKVAMIVTLSSVQSQAQADSTATSLLNLRLGLARTLVLRGVPNPALEPGDLIQVVHADERSEVQLVNSMALGLDVEGTLELGTRANYRPASLPRLTSAGGSRILSGDIGWRELQEAEVAEEAVA
jgi:Domain of unknown function (DUF5047)